MGKCLSIGAVCFLELKNVSHIWAYEALSNLKISVSVIQFQQYAYNVFNGYVYYCNQKTKTLRFINCLILLKCRAPCFSQILYYIIWKRNKKVLISRTSSNELKYHVYLSTLKAKGYKYQQRIQFCFSKRFPNLSSHTVASVRQFLVPPFMNLFIYLLIYSLIN